MHLWRIHQVQRRSCRVPYKNRMAGTSEQRGIHVLHVFIQYIIAAFTGFHARHLQRRCIHIYDIDHGEVIASVGPQKLL